MDRPLYFKPVVCIFLLLSSYSFLFYFASPNLSGRRLDVCHTSTRRGLSANLECRSETCCTWLAENTGRKITQKSPSPHRRTTLSGNIFAIKVCIDNRKKLVKRQYLLHMSSQYSELRPINGWDPLASLEHPSKFQRVSHFSFVTAATSFTGGQANFARCLSVSWAATLYIHFRGALAP